MRDGWIVDNTPRSFIDKDQVGAGWPDVDLGVEVPLREFLLGEGERGWKGIFLDDGIGC